MTAAVIALARCPFCGSKAMLEEVSDPGSTNPADVRFSVGCRAEDCIGFMSVKTYARRSEAVAAWNKRDGKP